MPKSIAAQVIFGSLVFCPLFAQAQTINRCEEAGKITYTEKACASAAQAKTVTIAANHLAQSDLNFKLQWKHYSVYGKDDASLRQSIQANGPWSKGKSFTGLASWRIGYAYQTKTAGKQCAFSRIDLEFSGEILMPKWEDEASASPSLRQYWKNAYAKLKIHEEGHIQHGREMALRMREHFLGLGRFDCDTAKTLAEREYMRIYEQLIHRDSEYDQRTEHGIKQITSM